MNALPRPVSGEVPEYYERYVATVPDGDILVTLRDQLGDTLGLLDRVSDDRAGFRYAPGKWSIREVVGHMMDTERLFAFRALAMARADGVNLPGMDQEVWADASGAEDRQLGEMAQEWAALRRANIHMFASLPAGAGERRGIASGVEFTVKAFPWVIAGHELWHRGMLEQEYGV